MTVTESNIEAPSPDRENNRAVENPNKEWLTFEALAVIAVAVALVAVAISIFSVGLATRAIDEHRSIPATNPATAGPSVAVSLSEFKIAPTPINATAGATLAVTNDGSVVHDLTVGTKAKTPELEPGKEADLSLAGLPPGTYKVYCQIPGHRDAGMQADLIVG